MDGQQRPGLPDGGQDLLLPGLRYRYRLHLPLTGEPQLGTSASANFKDGVLEVVFPGAAKSLMPQRRRIEIQSPQQSQSQGGLGTQRPEDTRQTGQSISQSTGESRQTTR